jgi:hypothetical protein
MSRAAVSSDFLGSPGTHLCRLGRNRRAGNASIERHTHPLTTFTAQWGGGQYQCSVTFVCYSFLFVRSTNGRTCRGSVAGVAASGRQVAPYRTCPDPRSSRPNSRSPGDFEMSCNISEIAVSRSNASSRSPVRSLSCSLPSAAEVRLLGSVRAFDPVFRCRRLLTGRLLPCRLMSSAPALHGQ